MSKQTAVEWLLWELTKVGYLPDGLPEAIHNKAKAIEREQHGDTWLDSRVELLGDGLISKPKSFEEYYNETYGKEASDES